MGKNQMGKNQKSKKKPHKKKNVHVKNDLSKGKELPQEEIEGSSSEKDSADSSDEVMLQKAAAALKKPAANASKNDESDINFDEDGEPKTDASGSEATHASSSGTTHGSSSENTQPNTVIVPKSNSIIVGNLSDNVTENELRRFFQKVGEILEIRLDAFDDGTCKGLAQVEFAQPEVVHKACMLNRSNLMGRPISINFGEERPTISLGCSSSERIPDGMSPNTILISGFDTAYGSQEIGTSLRVHFSSCGRIQDIVFLSHDGIGASIGFVFMEFADEDSYSNALQLNGSKLGGFTLHVEKAQSSGRCLGGGGTHGGGSGGGGGTHGGGGGTHGGGSGGGGGGGRLGRGGRRGRGGSGRS